MKVFITLELSMQLLRVIFARMTLMLITSETKNMCNKLQVLVGATTVLQRVQLTTEVERNGEGADHFKLIL